MAYSCWVVHLDYMAPKIKRSVKEEGRSMKSWDTRSATRPPVAVVGPTPIDAGRSEEDGPTSTNRHVSCLAPPLRFGTNWQLRVAERLAIAWCSG